MSGKGGSTWRHEWVPTNAAARRLKQGSYPGHKAAGSSQRGGQQGGQRGGQAHKEPKRYYVLRSLGGHLYDVKDRMTAKPVREHLTDKREAQRIADRMNRAGGYRT